MKANSQRVWGKIAALCAGAAMIVLPAIGQAAGGLRGKTGTDAELGYVWANQPTNTAAYTPSTTYSFNSRGGANTIQRTSVGRYTVRFGSLGTTGGTVQVTAYGAGNEICKVVSWGPSSGVQQVNVRCYLPNGTNVDAYFTCLFQD